MPKVVGFGQMCDHGVRHCGMPAIMLSAQLAQWADTRDLMADREPRWRQTQQTHATSPRCSVVRRNKLRDVSGRDTPQRISSPCVGTEQDQEPSALQVLQTLNSLEEGSVFLGGCAELSLHEINVTDGNTENTDSSLLGQSIASPRSAAQHPGGQ